MPKKAGASGDAAEVVESGAVPPPPRVAGGSIAFPAADDDVAAGSGVEAISRAAAAGPLTFDAELPLPSQTPNRTSPFQDDAAEPAAASFSRAPAFAPPRPLSEVSFDDAKPDPPRPAPPQPVPPFPVAGSPAPQAQQVAGASGMGISITGAPGMQAAPKQTPAQMSAANQSLRIRLLRADGKPFDGPEITTGPKKPDAAPGASRTEFDTPRGPKKQAPKVVVKSGPLERAGHILAVLLISAVGILPLAYLMLQSVHDREDKLAARITAPTKMNVLDSTSEAYLGGMAAVLLVVTVLYAVRLKRRRTR